MVIEMCTCSSPGCEDEQPSRTFQHFESSDTGNVFPALFLFSRVPIRINALFYWNQTPKFGYDVFSLAQSLI